MNETIKLHGNKYSKFLSKLIADWLEATDNTEVKILTKLNGKLDNAHSMDSGIGIIAVTDPAWFTRPEARAALFETEHLPLINQGKAFIVLADPFDEPYQIQIRVVEASEPVLTAKEFKCVIASSETAIIHLPGNSVMVADPQALDQVDNRITAAIVPGNYKVRAYHFYIRHKVESFYIVLSRTDEAAHNHWLRVSQFYPA